MPTVIDTSTVAHATAYSNQRRVDRCQNGVLWAVFARDGSVHEFWYSTNDGATWTYDSLLSAGATTYSAFDGSFFIDVDDYAHFVYKDTSDKKLYYHRGTPNATRTAWSWSAAILISGAASTYDFPDVVAHREGSGWVVHFVYSDDQGSSSFTLYRRYSIDAAGTVTFVSNATLGGAYSGNPTYPSFDFHHTGDGKNVKDGTPHLYVGWSGGSGEGIRFRKATYSAGAWTWGTEREIDSTRYVPNENFWLNCLFDGTRVVMGGQVYGSAYDLVLHERDAADTTTTTRLLLGNLAAANQLITGTLTYDGDGNVHLFGRGNSPAPYYLNYRKWTRSSAALGALVTIDSDTRSTPYASAKRGYSNNRIELIYTDGAASPYTVTYHGFVANQPPTAPGTPTTASPARGSQSISWSAGSDPEGEALTYDVELSMNNGSTWTRIRTGNTTTSYTYNFSTQGQSTTAKLRVRSVDSIGQTSGWTTGAAFTVNDLPTAPAVTAPNGGETWNASHTITWNAGSDPDVAASTLRYQIQLSTDGGVTYPTTIVSLTAAGATSYTYDFTNVPSTTAARIRIRTYDGIEYSAWDTSDANFTIQHNQAPNAPTLLSPANGGTIDLSGTVKYDWTFNDPDAGDSQSAFAFRRKISGAASYEYFNVSTGVWQSTEVWNGSTSTEYTFAAGQWANGNTYNWSVATKDSQGVAGPYAGDWTITGGTPPTTNVTSPVGTATASQPMVEWSYYSPDARAQLTYQVKVFSEAQYTAGGFDPNTSTAAWDSTEVASATTRNRQVAVALDQGIYRAYVRTQDSSNIYSAWAYAQFTLTYNPPGVPSITVADDPENARIIIDVQGHDNLLTENQASLETDTTGWEAGTNTTILRSTAQALDGVASLELTSAAAGDVSAYTSGGLSGVAVVADATYSALASMRASVARDATLYLDYYDDAGTLLRSDASAVATLSTTGWSQLSITTAAPEGAAYARVRAVVAATAAAGEVFYVDKAGFFPGSVTEWARGGIAYMTTFVVERSFDGGITWEPVRGTEDGAPHDGEPTQQLRVLDREMGPGASVTYRAYVKVEV